MSVRYPFTSRREVAERLSRDAEFVRHWVRVLCERTVKKCGGFMASHVVRARQLLPLLEGFVDDELLRQTVWLKAYARQIAKVMREEALRADPGLLAAGAVFGVLPPTAAVAPKESAGTPAAQGSEPASPPEKPRRRKRASAPEPTTRRRRRRS